MVFFTVKKPLKRLTRFISAGLPTGVFPCWAICGATLLLWSISLAARGQDIPSGFKVDRYAQIWEHNPFTLMKPAAPERQASAFEKLFLTSWLNNGGKEVVLVQNSETNEVQRITTAPNQNNLHLVEMHQNPNPQLVEAVISDGKEQGTVKFRFDAQPNTGQPPLAAAGQDTPQNQAGGSPSAVPAGLPSPGPTLPMSRLHPGLRKYHTEGQPGPNSARKGPPRKNLTPDQVPAQ
jgi:hypothetical protein